MNNNNNNKIKNQNECLEVDIPDPVPYILNESNILITEEYIQNILKKYSVNCKIKKIELFRTAMTHTSYLIRNESYYKENKARHTIYLEQMTDPTKAIPLRNKSYETLEFLGDAVIHHILANYFIHRYEHENEGFMTKLRTKIEQGDTLSQLSKAIGLNKYIIMSKYNEKNTARENNSSILEDSFEAFMGALEIDIGFDNCKIFFVNLLEQEVDFASILGIENNFKDLLLQFFHQRKWKDPCYGVLDISGPDSKRQFTMYVKCKKTPQDDGEIVGIGVGNSKKMGEQLASRQALKHFGILKEDDTDSETYEEIEES